MSDGSKFGVASREKHPRIDVSFEPCTCPGHPISRSPAIIRSPMITRREFSKLAGFSGAASLIPEIARAQEPRSTALPASIAELKSRRSEAKPITVEERRERMERARQLMRDHHFDAI